MTEIQKFFTDQTVFVTGATGFLGKILLEKLLRSCPDVKRIYILVRAKKGKDVNERFNDVFDKVLFAKLYQTNPMFKEKVVLLGGDCEQPYLGLSHSDQELFTKNVTVIFHVAATVKFNEPIKKATNINVRSVMCLIEMAKKMKNLKSFVHISTAFSNCNHSTIHEKFYETISSTKLISLVDQLDDDFLEAITPKLLGDFPNTYVFTKAVAETAVKEFGSSLPIAIVRPGIVLPTLDEPYSGWTNSIFGAIGLVVGIAVGMVRVAFCVPDKLQELVPADFVMNSSIAAAYDVGIKSEEDKKNDPPIYNFVSSSENPLPWNEFHRMLNKMRWLYPTTKCMWYPFLITTRYTIVYTILTFFLHFLPAYILDACLVILGKKPMLVKQYEKVRIFQNSVRYFALRQWIFTTTNTKLLWKTISDEDKQIFPFDISSYNWEEAIHKFVKGGRVYLLNDELETIPAGKRKLKMFYVAHIMLCLLVGYLFIKLLMISYSFLF